jgi:hypothetical protein
VRVCTTAARQRDRRVPRARLRAAAVLVGADLRRPDHAARLQKAVISVVVFLIVLVAAMGIANVLVLTVAEKTQDIAILRALGASSRGRCWRCSRSRDCSLGAAGTALGALLGPRVATYFRLQPYPLPGDLYFITQLPVEVQAWDVAWVCGVSLVTSVVASLLPARRAAGCGRSRCCGERRAAGAARAARRGARVGLRAVAARAPGVQRRRDARAAAPPFKLPDAEAARVVARLEELRLLDDERLRRGRSCELAPGGAGPPGAARELLRQGRRRRPSTPRSRSGRDRAGAQRRGAARKQAWRFEARRRTTATRAAARAARAYALLARRGFEPDRSTRGRRGVPAAISD